MLQQNSMDSDGVNAKTLGAIFRDLSEDVSTLVRSEVALAKLELRETAARVTAASGLFLAAVAIALLGLALLFVTGVLVIAIWVPAWAATLIVAVVLLLLAAVLGVLGRKKIASVEWVPNRAIDSIKKDLDTIKSDIDRIRER